MSFGTRIVPKGWEPGPHRTLVQTLGDLGPVLRMRCGDRLWFRPQDMMAPRDVSPDTKNSIHALDDPARLAAVEGLVLRRRKGDRFNIKWSQGGVSTLVEVEALAPSLIDGSVNCVIRLSTEPWHIINVKHTEIL
jgi:hypothetical protein